MSNEIARRNRSETIGCMITAGLVVGLFVVALLVPLGGSGPPSRHNACGNNMKLLSHALMNYHSVFGSFPPACTYDKNGKPMHSWRVLILPFLERGDIFAEYDFTQPWNSPYNRILIETVNPHFFRCPAAKGGSGETNYLAVVGDNTIWPMGKGISTGSIEDGASETILLVEVADSGIHWAEPRDLPFAQALQGINPPHAKLSVSSVHGGAWVALCDGRSEFLSKYTEDDVLQALLTRNGREPVVRDKQTDDFELSLPVTEVQQE